MSDAPNPAVLAALAEFGAADRVRVMPDSTRTAVDAAAALGCEVGAIGNSLVFEADGAPILVLTSGAHRVDTAALASRIGKTVIARATPELVRSATGQVIGGVAPLGHPAPLTTYVDLALRDFDPVWVSAGTPHSVYRTSFDELVSWTGGTPVTVD